MSNERANNHRESNGNRRDEHRATAKGTVDANGLHKEAQDPNRQPSSRGGGGLKPSDAPVLLLHRRGRADSNMLQDFDDEARARKYADEHKLLIVHAEKEGEQTKLYYLPE